MEDGKLFLSLLVFLLIPTSFYGLNTTEVPGSHNINSLKKITFLVKTDPEHYFPDLVRILAQNEKDPVIKVKNIHDWICQNVDYDYESYNKRDYSNTATDAYGVIKNGLTICAGYSKLFKAMCDTGGIKCEIISGHAKGLGYKKGEEYKYIHAWNAVWIGGAWKLIDVTWDDCLSNLNYFFTSPKLFIIDHFPEDPKWQLLDKPLAYSQYLELGERDNSHETGTIKTGYFGFIFSVMSPKYGFTDMISLIPSYDYKIGLMLFKSNYKLFNWDIQLLYTQKNFYQKETFLEGVQSYYINNHSFSEFYGFDTLIMGNFKLHSIGLGLSFTLQLPNRSFVYPYLLVGGAAMTDLLYSGFKSKDDLTSTTGIGFAARNDSTTQAVPYACYIVSENNPFNHVILTGYCGLGFDFQIPYAKKTMKKKLFGIEFRYEVDMKSFSFRRDSENQHIAGPENNVDLLKCSSLSIGFTLYL